MRGVACHVIDRVGELESLVRRALLDDIPVVCKRDFGAVSHGEWTASVAALTYAEPLTEVESAIRVRVGGPPLLITGACAQSTAAALAFDVGATYVDFPSLTAERVRRFLFRSLISRTQLSRDLRAEIDNFAHKSGLSGVQVRILLDTLGVVALDQGEYDLGPHGYEYHKREIRRKSGMQFNELPRYFLRVAFGRWG